MNTSNINLTEEALKKSSRNLFYAVVVTAIKDIFNTKSHNIEFRDEALYWVLSDCEDYQDICTLAGLDHSVLRSRILKLLR